MRGKFKARAKKNKLTDTFGWEKEIFPSFKRRKQTKRQKLFGNPSPFPLFFFPPESYLAAESKGEGKTIARNKRDSTTHHFPFDLFFPFACGKQRRWSLREINKRFEKSKYSEEKDNNELWGKRKNKPSRVVWWSRTPPKRKPI